ncbi:MAG TPA: acyl-CoA dehydrogenase family protein [Aestuariivirgaceae bacterium]|jgi:alkylation response protein AidB-like acyl-CoA dehydrogenase
MIFSLPDEARLWRDRLRKFVEIELQPFELEAEMNDGRIPAEAAARHERIATEMGLPRADAPKSYGGLALPMLAQVVIAEQLGRVTNALGWCYAEAQAWMFEAFNAEQIERLIVPMMRGERHICYAITEAESGSDPSAIHTVAEPRGDHYLLNGEKWHVTSANLSDTIIIQAKIGSGPNAGAHCLFFTPKDMAGIRIIRTPAYSHTYHHHHPIIRFENLRIPAANRIGAEGAGMTYAHAWFRRERLMIAARCCGAAARLIEEATEFSKTRFVAGEPIAKFQLIQAMLADSVTELHAGRLMTYEAASAHDRKDNVKTLHARCSIAKLYASEMAWRVADRAVQIFGGRGYMRENPAERYLRELRVDRIWEGTSEIQRLIIANNLIKRGLAETIAG